MAALACRARMPGPAPGTAALLAAVVLAGCGGAGRGAGSNRSGATAPGSATRRTSSTAPSAPIAPRRGSLALSPSDPTTSSELTFRFTAPVASGVHGKHVIGYTLSLLGPARTGCVGAREAGAPPVSRGAQAQITLGPAELHAPWCAGRYLARAIELRRAHCAPSVPCPEYVAVVGVVGRVRFTIRHG
ncbi:MAG TPA: hypothetical protein VKV21_08560 [Solirubrobacteraceae bacterium]|nr:hypothetical protein [Solirubrobacteraceae bacterium]